MTTKISFIGFGSMAKAIACGLTQSGNYQLSAASPSLRVGMNQDHVYTHFDNKEVIKDAEVIILAVKPSQMHPVLAEITPNLPTQCLLISVAAGLSLSWFTPHCHSHQAIIRTMPNTAASIGLAATPMIANTHTLARQKELAERIFSTIGITSWCNNEDDLDSFTALSGSGPAYVFLFVEALIEGAVTLGLEPLIAKQFALQTCKGAIELAEQSNLSLKQLRTQVTSPGGTTEAALFMMQDPLVELVLRAMQAAKQRANELSRL